MVRTAMCMFSPVFLLWGQYASNSKSPAGVSLVFDGWLKLKINQRLPAGVHQPRASLDDAGLSTDALPDRLGVLVHRLVGEADEDWNRDEQQQYHHHARSAQLARKASDRVPFCRSGPVIVFHRGRQ
jgi:hypothetical protein